MKGLANSTLKGTSIRSLQYTRKLLVQPFVHSIFKKSQLTYWNRLPVCRALCASWQRPLLTALLIALLTDSITAADHVSHQAALCQIFGEQALQRNAALVCLKTRALPIEQRFDQLAQWVLPGHGHSFRLGRSFRRSELPKGQAELADGTLSDLKGYPESAWMLSPARDLIDVATELNRVDQLTRLIETHEPSDQQQANAQTTLLTLIEIAAGDASAVGDRLEDRFAWQRTPANSGTASLRWSDLLVLWSAATNPATAPLVRAELFGVYPSLANSNEDIDLDMVNDYLRALQGHCQDTARRTGFNQSDDAPRELFDTFSRVDAASHGSARPLTRFRLGDAIASKITGHEIDYLAFRSPLTGDFEINCEVATRPGAFTELMVHGTATQPVGTKRLNVGGFAKVNRRIALTPPLESHESYSHLRVVVRDDVAEHFFNGRVVHQSAVDVSPTPWAALRSWRRTASHIRNLHLVGAPTIPKSIELLADTSLSGWGSYYDPATSRGLGSWLAVIGDDQSVQLVSGAASDMKGSYEEDLIRYLRPISWNARLSYEFEYQAGTVAVHPAFGRAVLLISPDGVRLHELTDGKFERTDLRPDQSRALENTASDSLNKPDLRAGWNQAELQIVGNTLHLSLNGQPIAQVELPRHARTFGLFHYRDQSRAVVRNVKLTGDWPKTLPSIEEQTLASHAILEFDTAAARLPANLVHDFRDGVPAELFSIDGDQTTLIQRVDGLRMGRDKNGGVKEMGVSAIIDGDFDITVGYEDLEIATGRHTWHCGVGLAVNLYNLKGDRCAINRRRDRMNGHHYVGFGRQQVNPGGRVSWIGGHNVVDESTSGKLRLVRRGTKIYGLHAIGDSPSFRIVRTEEVPLGPIEVSGLDLITDNGKGMHTSVTWTKLEIRAEKIDRLNVVDQQQTLVKLDEARKQHAATSIDFTKQSLEEAGITTSGSAELTSDENGATVNAVGAKAGNRFALVKRVSLTSEFDVQADFEILKLDRGFQGQPTSEVVLQIRLEDSADHNPDQDSMQIYEATMILRHRENGRKDLRTRIVGTERGGKTIRLSIRSIPVNSPGRYRIVQHDQMLYFIFAEQGTAEEQIIATYPLPRKLSASSIKLWTIASRDGRVAKTCWKNIQIHGVAVP